MIELAERCNYWPEHAGQVARLALALFDQTRAVHQLGDRERDWLEYGALLPDIGSHISFNRHHRHSYYLVKNGALRGFGRKKSRCLALIARYHRRATPKRAHDGYRELPKPIRQAVTDPGGYRAPREGWTGAMPGRRPRRIGPDDGSTFCAAKPRGTSNSNCGLRTGTLAPLEERSSEV